MRNAHELNYDVLSIIFQHFSIKDRLTYICLVCTDWLSALKYSDIHQLPFSINEKDLLGAIQSLKSLPTSSKIKINNT